MKVRTAFASFDASTTREAALPRLIGSALFFLMLVVPTVYQPLKALLLALTLGFIVAGILLRKRVALHPAVALGTLVFTAVGLLFALRGTWLGAPGAVRMLSVYVAWPLVFTVLIAGASSNRMLVTLLRVLVVSLFAICLYSLSYVLWSAGWLSGAFYLPLDQGQRISFRAGVVEFKLYSIASLLYLVPFAIAAVVAWPTSVTPVRRRYLYAAVFLGVLVTLLSGRRGLMLVVAFSPCLAWAGLWLLPRAARQRVPLMKIAVTAAVLVVAVGVVLRWTLAFDPSALLREFTAGFQFSTDPVAMSRASQFDRLLSAWLDVPLLGAGYGAVIPQLVRSAEMPWAFELSYMALLFNTGIVGVLAYGGGIVWLFLTGLRVVASGHYLGRLLLPVLVGSASFLIANATNPYLLKYDYEWVVFLPIAFINAWLLDRHAGETRETPR